MDILSIMDKLHHLPDIPATQAKQAFGEMLDRLRAEAAIAITSHKRVKAVLTTPEHWATLIASAQAPSADAERFQARLAQEHVEFERLQKHSLLAIKLLSSTPEERDALLASAQARVHRWRAKQLCSDDIIEMWESLLQLPHEELAREMVGDCAGWGRVLRQNTPFSLGPSASRPARSE